ncbi:MAG TPA: arsenate reductase (glutaredoxin) [Rhizomicrobium sp.]|nr:arsenate reductase (glutaredoxin) [Rhizomicrobium sp.]
MTIYHNPKCSNSRRCLEIVREEGFEPTIIEYLQHPPTAAALERLVREMGISVRDVIRTKEEPVYAELNLKDANDGALLKAVANHPILLNRPIVVTDKGAKLCRPPELVRDLL